MQRFHPIEALKIFKQRLTAIRLRRYSREAEGKKINAIRQGTIQDILKFSAVIW